MQAIRFIRRKRGWVWAGERKREEPDVYIERDGKRASGILPVKPCTARQT